MIGDEGHGDPLYTRVVISSLNDWVSEWEQAGKTEVRGTPPLKIYLILEMDSAQASRLKKYFQNGAPIETFDPFNFIGYQFTTGSLQFYYDLRILRQHIDMLNVGRSPGGRLAFEVFGPEKVVDPSGWTPARRDSFFVFGREE